MSRKQQRVFFWNEQWVVTPRGIEARKPERYSIRATDLMLTRLDRGQVCYDWVLHMAEKREWVMVPAFIEAFVAAMRQHHGGHDEDILRNTRAAYSRSFRHPARLHQFARSEIMLP